MNAYLKEISGEEFTAKDFRTWAGTVLAARALQEFQTFDSQAQAKRNVVQAIEAVAKRLGNTKAVCRKCYVHPRVIDLYMDGSLLQTLKRRVKKELSQSLHGLPPEEAAVLALLQQRLGREERGRRIGECQWPFYRAVEPTVTAVDQEETTPSPRDERIASINRHVRIFRHFDRRARSAHRATPEAQSRSNR